RQGSAGRGGRAVVSEGMRPVPPGLAPITKHRCLGEGVWTHEGLGSNATPGPKGGRAYKSRAEKNPGRIARLQCRAFAESALAVLRHQLHHYSGYDHRTTEAAIVSRT